MERLLYSDRSQPKELKPDPEKLKAILQASDPENLDLLHSFVATSGYLMKCIPNYVDILEPLHLLTRKGTTWHWSAAADTAFQATERCIN